MQATEVFLTDLVAFSALHFSSWKAFVVMQVYAAMKRTEPAFWIPMTQWAWAIDFITYAANVLIIFLVVMPDTESSEKLPQKTSQVVSTNKNKKSRSKSHSSLLSRGLTALDVVDSAFSCAARFILTTWNGRKHFNIHSDGDSTDSEWPKDHSQVSVGMQPMTEETFSRVRSAYDLDHLQACRIVAVGVGGAVGFLEDVVRAGIGQIALIDPDIVSESNIGTQQVYRKDLGRPKVECLSERLLDVNPNLQIIALHLSTDEIPDCFWSCILKNDFRRIGKPSGHFSPLVALQGALRHKSFGDHPAKPKATLLCGLTDNFEAQARVNRLALQFEVPSLCAQVYKEGRGAEITFTFPGVTPACHRCCLNSRYKAFLEDDFRNNVTSDGTPIFSTTRLNALKGMIAMALLHHGTNHLRWGKLLSQIGNRNLVLLRLDPDISSTLGLSVFDRVLAGADQSSLLFDEPLWRPQQPDCPDNGYPFCPDCGGTGDLRDSKGLFKDTLVMRK